MDNTSKTRELIIEFLLASKSKENEWRSETEIAEACSSTVEDVRAHLLVLAAEKTMEISNVNGVLRARILDDYERLHEPPEFPDPLEVGFDTLDSFGNFIGRLGCIFPILGALIGVLLPLFFAVSPSLEIIFFSGLAGLLVGGIIGKEVKR